MLAISIKQEIYHIYRRDVMRTHDVADILIMHKNIKI